MKQGFIVCGSYAKELKVVVDKLGISEIKTLIVPSTCANANDEEVTYFAKQKEDFEKEVGRSNILLSRSCINHENGKRKDDNGTFACPSFCIENFVPPELLNYYIEKKYYIVTVGWILQWKHTVISRWKFDENTAKMFFNDTAREILVIDTGVYDDYEKELKEFSKFVNLKYTILPFGLNYFEKQIEAKIYRQLWQKKSDDFLKYKKDINQRISEYAMIIDLIPTLSTINSEQFVIDKIIELYTVLFAPEHITYVRNTKNDESIIIHSDHKKFSIEELLRKTEGGENCFINEDKKGFITKISYNGKVHGYILIENILFPQYISRYINFTQSLVPFFGLLISNSRQYAELEELKNRAEKGRQEYQDLYENYKSMNVDLKELNVENESLLEEQTQSIEEITTLNESLASKNEKLDELNASKDKLFSIIAHDLRNPFTSVLGFSSLLRKNSNKYSTEKINSLIRIIDDSAQNIYVLLENLLNWSRIQRKSLSPRLEKINPTDIISETVSLCKQMLVDKNIDLRLILDYDKLILADKEMMKAVIRNLLINAIKFSYPQGIITMETQESNNNLVFKIVDSGTGIESNHQTSLFKEGDGLLKQGTANEKGSGLGLILCKEFVEKHGGEIWVESKDGAGSTFSFTIPLNHFKEKSLSEF